MFSSDVTRMKSPWEKTLFPGREKCSVLQAHTATVSTFLVLNKKNNTVMVSPNASLV